MAIIRISGTPGAGKTTLAKHLAEHLKYTHFYAGGVFRRMAQNQGLSIEDFYAKIAEDPNAERHVDTEQAHLMQTQDNLIVEGRMAPFQPSPFKTVNMKITSSLEEGIRRMAERDEYKGISLDEMRERVEKRIATEREHYFRLYGIEDHLADSHFDIMIDTTHLSPNETFAEALSRIEPLL